MARELTSADVIERIDAEWRGLRSRGLHAGALASASWLSARCVCATAGGWEVTIALGIHGNADTTFRIAITAQEWGFVFSHGRQTSWIRVTDTPFVYERDDFGLLKRVPPLRDLGDLTTGLEERFDIDFRREAADIRSTLVSGEDRIRAWVITSL